MPPRTSNRRPVPLSQAINPPQVNASGTEGDYVEQDISARLLKAQALFFNDRTILNGTGITGYRPGIQANEAVQIVLNGASFIEAVRTATATVGDDYFAPGVGLNVRLGLNTQPWHGLVIGPNGDSLGGILFQDGAAAPAVAGQILRNGNDIYYYDGTTAHKLNLATGYGAAGYPQDVAATEADGSAALIARSDHVHKLGILTTKGDIIGYSTLPARLAVGANDTVLTAASGESTGLKWATVNTPTLAVVTSDDTNDDTMAASVLAFTIGANEQWAFRVTCYIDEATSGFESDLTVPSGATGWRTSTLHDSTGVLSTSIADFTTDQGFTSAQMNDSISIIEVFGQIASVGTGGTVTFNFKNEPTDGSFVTLKAGSYLIAHKLA